MDDALMTGQLGDKAAAWLEARGLDLELCVRMGLHSVARAGASFIPLHTGDWIAVPYVVGSRLVNTKYRRLDRKEHAQTKGGEQRFWNEDCLRDPGLAHEPLIITEGEWDALAAMTAGYKRVVSVPGGAAEKGEPTLRYIDPVVDALEPIQQIILAVDADQPGANLLRQLSARLGRARCAFVRYPTGCKDLGDALRAGSVEAVRGILEKPYWIELDGLYTEDDLPPSPDWVIWRPKVSSEADKMLAFCAGRTSVVTGRWGHGKSQFLQHCMLSICREYDLRACLFSQEKDMDYEFKPEVAAWLASKPIERLTPEDVEAARAWRAEHIVYIVEPRDGEMKTVEWLLDRMTAAAHRHGAKFFVIDPWNAIEHSYDARFDTETRYIGRTLKMLERFATRWDAHVAIVAHPTKLKAGERPDGYSISGSANWGNMVHLGVTIARESDDPTVSIVDMPTILDVWKIKNHAIMGRPGETMLEMGVGYRFQDFLGRYDRRSSEAVR